MPFDAMASTGATGPDTVAFSDGEANMYARVAKWEGADGNALKRTAEEMRSRAASGPPPGVPAKGFLMLIDPDSGQSLAISLFETHEDLQKGHEALNAMNPESPDDAGERTSVELYEVAVDVRL